MIVFIDTNTFLHFAHLDQIKWADVLATSNLVTLVVAPVVIKELDKHKYSHPTQKVRQRAADSLKKIEAWIEAKNIRQDVALEYNHAHPSIDFSSYGLNPLDCDDQLLAKIIESKKIHPEAEIALLTADTGLRLKCKSVGVKAVSLPSEYQLPSELDQIAVIRRENEELKRLRPVLTLEFPDKSNRIQLTAQPQDKVSSEDIDRQIDALRERYPEQTPPPPPIANSDGRKQKRYRVQDGCFRVNRPGHDSSQRAPL